MRFCYEQERKKKVYEEEYFADTQGIGNKQVSSEERLAETRIRSYSHESVLGFVGDFEKC